MHLGITAASGTLVSSSRFIRLLVPVAIALAGIGFGSVSHAADIYHTADDGAGFSGFNDSFWSVPGTPSAGNNYFVVNFTIRSARR